MDKEKSEQRYMSVKSLAVYLDETPASIRMMRKRNQIPASCVAKMPGRTGRDGKPLKGRKIKFDRIEIDKWMESRKPPTPLTESA